MQPRVSIIGTGHVGCALAADLSARGFDVLLHAHPAHRKVLDAITAQGELSATGTLTSTCRPATSVLLKRAVQHAEQLIIALPAQAHDDLVSGLAAFDLRRHLLLCITGNFFGLAAQRRLHAAAMVETNTSPFPAKVNGNTVFVKETRSALWAASQAPLDDARREQVHALLPQTLRWLPSTLANGLSCITGVIRPVAALMNTGWIESAPDDFQLHHQGMTPSVIRIMQAVDRERLQIAASLGLHLPTARDTLNICHGQPLDAPAAFAHENALHPAAGSPAASMAHHCLLQDVPHLLVPWRALAQRMGVPTPALDALVHLAAHVHGLQPPSNSGALRRLGLDEPSNRELHALARGEGVPATYRNIWRSNGCMV